MKVRTCPLSMAGVTIYLQRASKLVERPLGSECTLVSYFIEKVAGNSKGSLLLALDGVYIVCKNHFVLFISATF